MTSAAADPLSVLLVEDDSQLLRTLSDILRRRGYATLSATSGREGVSLARASRVPPAVALVDLRLPDMDGMEVIASLRRISELTETVVLTGHASLDTAVRALREHSCDYLVKPVAPDQLFPIVERAGERWQRRMAEEALRRTDERYRLLLENISDVIAVAAPDHTLRYVSPSVAHVLGYEPHELIGQSGAFFTHPDDMPAVNRFVQETLGAPGSSGVLDVRLRHRNGTWRLLEFSTTNLIDRAEIGGLLYIARDVTERRQFEAQVLQAQKMESIGSLAGGVAHDFNNVLTAIIGYGEMIASDDGLGERARADLEEMIAAANRASALTRQLLAFSRRQATEPRVFDVNGLIDALLNMLRRLIGESVELHTRLAPDLWAVRADPGQMEQVLMNLSVNARDAMPDGGRLTIGTENVLVLDADASLRGSLAPGDYVLLTVRDSGPGMSEDVKARAFEPFFTTKAVGKGTGLGLSTCYGIVKQAGGQIVIDTAPGAGTTVRVYVPRTDAAIEPLAAKLSAEGPGARHETVLVVDDDAAVRHLVTRVVALRGYEALEASDAPEALDVLQQRGSTVHLLLTDVGLPGTNGFTLAETVLSRWPQVKVLYMSGYDRTGTARGRSPARSARASIQKPFTPADLLAKIRSVLDSPEARA
jgi:two-component system, cell cycle sensor histidine kinase and response regulator CckA